MMSRWFFLFITIILAVNFQIAAAEEMQPGIPSGDPPAALAKELRYILETGLSATDIPGVQAGISTPQWTGDFAAGIASVTTGEPALPGMQFLIASITKTFTAVAVLKLAEEGQLSLDDPIDKWLPSDLVARIPDGRKITIRNLLDHTSGIADYDEMAIIEEELKDPSVPVSYSEAIEQGLNASPLYPVGTNYTYSNVNYNLLTLIIDKASGSSYEDYVNERIIIPAGLNQTFIQRERDITGPHMNADTKDADGTINAYGSLYVRFDRGAGDIVSTAADLNTFHRALRDGMIISKASFADMDNSTPQSRKIKNAMTSGYGLGYASAYNATQNITLEGHSGGYPGSFSFMYYCPEIDTYVAMNVNILDETSRASREILLPLLNSLESAKDSEQ